MTAKLYTFSEIFEAKRSIADLVRDFGYSYETGWLDLPKRLIAPQLVASIEDRLRRRLPKITLSSEMARREFIVADILGELLDLSNSQLEVEYAVTSERLRGNVDYLLRGQQNLVVIEAKNDEMERGFQQLAAELSGVSEQLALDVLYGAVTTGQQWQFGRLKRSSHLIMRDLQPYSIPGQVAELLGTLLGLAEGYE